MAFRENAIKEYDYQYGESVCQLPELPSKEKQAVTGLDVADYFYSKHSVYEYFDPEGSAHCCTKFTQLVWMSTKQLGCAYNVSGGQVYVSCRYFPKGNIPGEFKENVLQEIPILPRNAHFNHSINNFTN